MSTFRRFEDIEAWQKARELTKVVYQLSGRGHFAKDFGLRDQIRRASVSIMANIAEGFERDGTGEFIQFLAIAKGSAAEVLSHAYVAWTKDSFAKASRLPESEDVGGSKHDGSVDDVSPESGNKRPQV